MEKKGRPRNEVGTFAYFWCFKGVVMFFCCVVHTCNISYPQCDDSADDADDSTDDTVLWCHSHLVWFLRLPFLQKTFCDFILVLRLYWCMAIL